MPPLIKKSTPIRLTNKWGVTRFPSWMRNGDLFLAPLCDLFTPVWGCQQEYFVISVCYSTHCDSIHILFVS